MKRLPRQIALVMLGTILLFVLTSGAAVLWLARALDQEAYSNTEHQAGRALDDLLRQTGTLAFDYAKWDDAYEKALDGDVAWYDENFGTSATLGRAMQLLAVWDSSFGRGRGWVQGGPFEGRTGLVDPLILDQVDRQLAPMPLGAYDGAEFFAWNDGQLFAVVGTRIEPMSESDPIGPPPAEDGRPRLLVGRLVDEATIQAIAEDVHLSNLRLASRVPEGAPSIPFRGPDGASIARLVWDPPQPGTDQLWRIAPPLLLVLVLALALMGLGTSLVRRNATALVRAERQASRAARTDPLTELPNRAAFNAALAVPARPGERAVLFLDVNDFKRINDSIGHEAGDQVILGVARRLEGLSGPESFLARIAGDEFVFIVTGPEAEARTRALAGAVRAALERPFVVVGHEMRVDLAMGYAVQANERLTGPDLVRQADLAMYEAKRHKGQAGMVAFDEVIAQASRHARVIERGLRRALEGDGGLAIAYQPIVGPDGRIVRAEALARWTSRELGPVPPDRFIPVAEQAGLIVPLGRRLLGLVCDDLVRHPALRVSLNVSTLQLMAPDFIPALTRQLDGCGIAPDRVEVELTEGVLVDDARLAAERLGELRAAGFSTALDDFGTGYSSMGYLERLGFDTLKVDRSVVGRIRGPAGGTEVVRGIIIMAHGFGMRVVCEGVESEEDLRRLLELGCDLAQGHHLSPPQPVEALVARWLRPGGGVAAVA